MNMNLDRHKFSAFTLAETLITLMVIGVVAVLTIPALMQQIGDYTLGKQKTVFEKKFAEGLRQMRVDDKLSEKYASTADFVNAMGKYFKISAVCNKDNLTGCFPDSFTAKAILNGEETASKSFTTSDIKTSKNLVEKSAYDTDVMGIVFSDGVKMLITYDTGCTGIESGDTTGNLYSCFGYVADVNGDKSPNLSEKDIISNLPLIKNFGLSFEIANNKLYTANEVGYLSHNGYVKDYWYAAQQKCEELGASLPSPEQLEEIAETVYGNANCTISTKNSRIYYYSCDKNAIKDAAIIVWGSNSSEYIGFGAWTSTESFFRAFNENSSDYNNDYNWNHTHGSTFFCVK